MDLISQNFVSPLAIFSPPPSSVDSLAACHIFSFYPLCLHQFTPHPGPESSGLAMAHLPNTVILTLEMSGRFMFLILSLESHVILRVVGGGCKIVEKERTEKERERVGWQRSRLSVYSLASTPLTLLCFPHQSHYWFLF